MSPLDGRWRIVNITSAGHANLASPTTHFIIDGERFLAYDPDLIDGGKWASLTIDGAAGRFTHEREVGSGAQAWLRTDRWLFKLEGDTLRLCWPRTFGEYPDRFDDQFHGVYTCTREMGELPACKQHSGQEPVYDPVLGRLVWSDNEGLWRGSLGDGATAVTLHLAGFPPDDLPRAREIVNRLRLAEPELRAFATDKLLPLYNCSWGDTVLDAPTFAACLRLQYLTVEADGRANVWFADGGLFRGHSVTVYVSAAGVFEDANIEG